MFIKKKAEQLHAVSPTQQGRQSEPNVKALRPTFRRILEALRVEWPN